MLSLTRNWTRYLAVVFFAAFFVAPLGAQEAIATLTCSGDGQATLSLPTYAFKLGVFQLPLEEPPQGFGFAIVPLSQFPTLLAVNGTTYGSCSISNGTHSFSISNALMGPSAFMEVTSDPSVSSTFALALFVSLLPVPSQQNTVELPFRSSSPLTRQLDAIVAKHLAALKQVATEAH